MASQPQNVRLLRFGVFEADLQARELRKSGLKIKIHDQPFQILAALLEHPGEIVTREELHQRIWPADTFVDFDHGLNTAVNKLRDALGDSAASARYIETLPRRGYRFLGPFEMLGDGSSWLVQAEPAREIIRPAAKPKHRSSLLWAAGLLIPVAAGVAIWLLTSHANQQKLQPHPVVVPLTTYAGSEDAPSFSPDGNQVAFFWDGHIWVKQIGTESKLRLTSDAAEDGFPAWSPDGRYVAFQRFFPGGKVGVFLVPPIGGPERKLTETEFPSTGRPGLSWSPNGKWLALTDRSSGESEDSIYLLSVESSEKRRLTFPPARYGDGDAAFSPDGRSLAFSRAFGSPVTELYLLSLPVSELYLLSLSDNLTPKGEPKQLTFRHQWATRLAWTPDGQEIVFASGPGSWSGLTELWRMPVSGSDPPRRLEFSGDRDYFPAISRQGNRLAFMRNTQDDNIYRLELPGPDRKAGEPVALISSTRNDLLAQYSPDGKRIAFASSRSGRSEVWVCNSDGSSAVQLTFTGVTASVPRWSPDGKRLVFSSNAEGPVEVYVGDASGGRPRRLTNPPADGDLASFSRDGRRIYFVSARTARFEIWKMPAEGGEQVQVTRNGGWLPFESPDGKYVYYTNLGGLWKVPVGGGEEKEVLHSIDERAWAVVKHGVYFGQRNPDGNTAVRFLRFGTGKTTTITTIKKPLGGTGGFSISPEERYLLYTQMDQWSSDLMLVENFR
jgi:Tol biopolymer transport system component/DNA-binding winged helix-turn-helix (wHTH) protein